MKSVLRVGIIIIHGIHYTAVEYIDLTILNLMYSII